MMCIFFSYFHFTAAVAYLALIVFVLVKDSHSLLNRLCVLFLTSMFLWSFGGTFVNNPYLSLEQMWVFEKIEGLGWVNFSGLFLVFFIYYTGWRRRRLPIFLLIAATQTVFTIKHFQGVFLGDYQLHFFGWIGAWKANAWTFAFYVYYTAMVLWALALVYRFFRTSADPLRRKPALIFFWVGLISFVLGSLSNVVLRWFGLMDIPPLADIFALIWSLGMAVAVTRYRLMSITPARAADEIVSTMSDTLVLLNSMEKIEYVNPAGLEMVGQRQDELSGLSFHDIINGPERCRNPFNCLFGGKGDQTCELHFRTKRHGSVPVSMHCSRLSGIGYICVARDITAQKQAAAALKTTHDLLEEQVEERTRSLAMANVELEQKFEALQKAEARLHQAEKLESVGQLAGGMAHDFNNMLGSISGYASLIERDDDNDTVKMKQFALRILDISHRGAELIAKLLDFARRGRQEKVLFDMHVLLSDVVELLQHTLPKEIRVTCALQSPETVVLGDRTQIQNSLLNMAFNARDAMPGGGKLLFSTLYRNLDGADASSRPEPVEPGRYLVISVRDTGMGMDNATRERIFEPFFTTKVRGKGTGLGLSSVYGILKRHGGFVEVESVIGKGTLFQIALPLAPPGSVAETLEKRGAAVHKGTGLILVADDDADNRETTSELLRTLNYTVITCSNGREALQLFRERGHQIDLVILDMIMPEMGGLECLREIRKLDASARIVAITGYALENELAQMSAQGAFACLRKPYDSSELSRTVAGAIRR